MTKKRWPWRKSLLAFALIGIAIYGTLQFLGWILWRPFLTPEIYTSSNINEFREEQKTRIKEFLMIEIPKSAKDIYYFGSGGRDRINLCSFTLTPEKIGKFAQEFVGVPLSQFHKLEDYRGELTNLSVILRGPTIWGGKWKTPYWNVEDIIEKCTCFQTDKQFSGTENFMIVDPDANRIYIGIWNA